MANPGRVLDGRAVRDGGDLVPPRAATDLTAPLSAPPGELARLQRAAGNLALQRLLLTQREGQAPVVGSGTDGEPGREQVPAPAVGAPPGLGSPEARRARLERERGKRAAGGEMPAPEPEIVGLMPAPTTPTAVATAGVAEAQPEEAAPAAGEPAQLHPSGDMGEMRGQVLQAADSLPHPAVGFTAAQSVLRAEGFRWATAHRGAASGSAKRVMGGGGGPRRRLPPELEELENPPEPDPAPQSTRKLREKCNRKLDPVTNLPETKASPRQHMPKLGKQPVPDDLFRVITGTMDEGLLGTVQVGVREDLQKELQKWRDSLQDTPDPQAAEGRTGKKAEEVPEFPDPPAPMPLELPATSKADLTGVFARLLADVDETAKGVLAEVRESAPSVEAPGAIIGPALSRCYVNIGEAEFKGDLAAKLKTELEQTAREVGITDDDLRKKIEERKEELRQRKASAAQGAQVTTSGAAADVRGGAQDRANAVAGAKQAADDQWRHREHASRQPPLPMDTESRKQRQLDGVTRVVSRQVEAYRRRGETRKQDLDRKRQAYQDAYHRAVQQDLLDIETEATRNKTLSTPETQRARDASRKYETDALTAVTARMDELKTVTDARIKTYQDELRQAGDERREAVRAWADRRSGTARSDEQRARDRLADTEAEKKAETEATASAERQQVVEGLAGEYAYLTKLNDQIQSGMTREAIIQQEHLDEARIALLDQLLATRGTGTTTPVLDLVVEHHRKRLAREKSAEIGPKLEPLVPRQEADYEKLGEIGHAQRGSFTPKQIADKVYNAVEGWGTDEAAIFEGLANLTAVQITAVRGQYQADHDESLQEALEDDLSGREQERALTLIDTSPVPQGEEAQRADAAIQALETSDKIPSTPADRRQARADAIGLRQAMKGNWEGYDLGVTGIGVDKEAINELLRGKSPEEKARIRAAYKAMFGADLVEDVHEELYTERDKERFDATVAGDTDLADAIELRDLLPTQDQMHNPDYPVYPDREKVAAVFDRVRREETARGERLGKSTAEIEALINIRLANITRNFDTNFAKDYPTADQGAFRSALDLGFQYRPEEKNLLVGLATNDIAKVDAARIELEHQGVYASDKEENRVLRSQYLRALDDQRRDQAPLRRILLARQMARWEQDEVKAGRTKELGSRMWAEQRRLERAMDRTLESAAAQQAIGNMNALRVAYQRDYGETLDDVVNEDTQGYGNREAKTLLAQGGYLTPAQAVFYAIRGSGTQDEMLKGALKGRTAAEIEEIRKEFRALAIQDNGTALGRFNRLYDGLYVDNTDMDAEIKRDLSGRTEFDVSQLLKGDPETLKDQKQRLLQAIEWEEQSSVYTRNSSSTEERAMRHELAELTHTIDRLDSPTATSRDRHYYLEKIERDIQDVQDSIEIHRKSLDSLVDKVTTAVGLVVGIVVGAVLTIVTGGAAGPVLIAVVGSIAATAATMATKAIILGDAYGWEDVATDLAIGVVDAVFAAVTAGLGEKLLGLAKAGIGAGAKTAEQAAKLSAQLGLRGMAARFFLSGGGRMLNPAEGALARAVPTSGLLSGMVKRGGAAKLFAVVLAEGVENLAANTGSALTGTLLNKQTWDQGNPLTNIAFGTLKQAGMSAGMGLAFKPVFHFGGKIVETVAPFFRNLAGHPNALHEAWLTFKAENPHARYEDFVWKAHAELATSPEIIRALPSDEPLGVRPEAPSRSEELELREQQLRERLPERFRESVPIEINEKLEGRAVEVRYREVNGVITEIRLVAGPSARPIDVLLHVGTIQSMRRYSGLAGRARVLLERITSWVIREGPVLPGTRAFEARLEVEKLHAIVLDRVRALGDGTLDARARDAILADIEHLSREIDRHQATWDRLDLEPGEGFVARSDTSYQAARDAGYPRLSGHERATHHYVQVGPGDFILRRNPGYEGKRTYSIERGERGGLSVKMHYGEPPRLSFAEERAAAAREPELRAPSDAKRFEAAASARKLTTEDLCMLRKQAGALEFLERLQGKAVDYDALLGDLGPGFTAGQHDRFRREVRSELAQAIVNRPVAEQKSVLAKALASMPDSSSKGHLFAEYNKARLQEEVRVKRENATLSPLGGDRRKQIANVSAEGKRFVDDFFKVTSAIEGGPRRAGNYAAEYKAGPEAFDPVQAKAYSDAIAGRGLRTVDGKRYEGIIYVFDDVKHAREAVAFMEAEGLSDRIHVSYYDGRGVRRWLR